jgi:hypothetical protein
VFQLDCTAHRLPITTPNLVVTRKTRPRLHHTAEVGQRAIGDAKLNAVIAWLDAMDYPESETVRNAADYARDLGTCPHYSMNRVKAAQGKRSARVTEYDDQPHRKDLE